MKRMEPSVLIDIFKIWSASESGCGQLFKGIIQQTIQECWSCNDSIARNMLRSVSGSKSTEQIRLASIEIIYALRIWLYKTENT